MLIHSGHTHLDGIQLQMKLKLEIHEVAGICAIIDTVIPVTR